MAKKTKSESPNFLLQKIFDLLVPFIMADHKVTAAEINILAEQYLPLVSDRINPLMQDVIKQGNKIIGKASKSRKPLPKTLAALKKAVTLHDLEITSAQKSMRQIIVSQFEDLTNAEPAAIMTNFSDAVKFFRDLDESTINSHLLKAIIRILNESSGFEPSTLKLLALIGVLWDVAPLKLAKEVKAVRKQK